ncbi:MAG: AAA family ATPase [Neisseriaceae bacterium]
MLLNITVENFRSYDKEQTLSLIASNENFINTSKVGTFNVYKSAVIYGANASGKSNLIKAISVLQNVISNGVSSKYYQPFFFNNRDTRFNIDFEIKGKIYTYSIHYNAEYIDYEALLDESENIIFERIFKKLEGKYEYVVPNAEKLLSEGQLDIAETMLKTWQLSTNKDRSFLTQIIDSGCEKLKDILPLFDIRPNKTPKIIFRDNQYINTINPFMPQADLLFATNYYRLHDDFESINIAMQAIGATFNRITPQDVNVSPSDGANNAKPFTLNTTYNINGQDINVNFFQFESDGTQKFYNYYALLKFVIENESILIVDELEAHFHPLLVEEIITQINNSDSKAQLIFTSHSPLLLNEGVFEREQIYFAEKNEDNTTNLFSLADFKDLKDVKDIVAKYLSGNFGAIPYFHSIDFDSDK